jgi:hypothetical protein
MAQRSHLFQGYQVVLAKEPNPAAPQAKNVAISAESAAEIAGKRADVSSFAAFGGQDGVVRIGRFHQFEPVHDDRASREFDALTVAGEIISAFTRELDRRKTRRHLFNPAGKLRQELFDCAPVGTGVAPGDDLTLGIIGIALLAPADGESVRFSAIDDERHRFGRFAQRNRQASGGERIECSGMSGTACRKQILDNRNGMG